MEVKMLDMKDIKIHTGQCRETFNHEKLMELTNSIKESELLQPIVVRKLDDNRYGIVCGERRFRAFEYLHQKQIPAIVREIKDDTDALEKSLIENLQRDDLTSVERENAVGALWYSGRYKTKEELSRKLGITGQTVREIIEAKEFRKKTKDSFVSTGVISDTSTLSDEPRKKIIDSVSQGKIQSKDVRDVVRKVKEFEEPEQQMEILNEFERQNTQSKEIFDDIIEKKREIAKGESEIEHFKEKNADQIRADSIVELFEKTSSYTSSYFKMIKSEKELERAIRYLKKTRDHINKVLIGLGETKVIDVDK